MKFSKPFLWIVVALVINAVVVLTYCACWKFGRGGKTFFSKDTLNLSYRHEILVPIVNIPIWSGSVKKYRPELLE